MLVDALPAGGAPSQLYGFSASLGSRKLICAGTLEDTSATGMLGER